VHNGLVGERFSVGGGVYWLGKVPIDITASLFGAFNPLEESNLLPQNDFNNAYQCLSFGSRACAAAIRICPQYMPSMTARSASSLSLVSDVCSTLPFSSFVTTTTTTIAAKLAKAAITTRRSEAKPRSR